MKRYIALLLTLLTLAGSAPALGEATTAPDATALVSQMAATYTPDQLLDQWKALSDVLRGLGKYPFVELKKGDTGQDVRALQTRLAELGYYRKEVVDNFGSGTYNALRAFEKANGLSVNGIASVEDQQKLFGSDAVAASEAPAPSKNSGGSSSKADATSSATKGN